MVELTLPRNSRVRKGKTVKAPHRADGSRPKKVKKFKIFGKLKLNHT